MSIKSSIILRPILSEKGTMLSEALNKYVFQVEKQCNKLEIKDTIEEKDILFDSIKEHTILESNRKITKQ